MAGGSNTHDVNGEEGVNNGGGDCAIDPKMILDLVKSNRGDEEGEEDKEEEEEEDADSDVDNLLCCGEMDPTKFEDLHESGAEPYKQFEKLKCQVLAEQKRKAFSDYPDETGKKSRHEGHFGADFDEIRETLGAVATKRRRKKPKKRGRKKGSKANLTPEVARKLGEANIHYVQNKYVEAIRVLKEVMMLAPNLPDSYHTLGLVYNALGEEKKALNFYLIAAHLRPKDVYLWKRLYEWSMKLGYVEQVIYCLNKAIAADPEDVDLRFKKASLYIERGDYQKAAESFHHILKLLPADVETCITCAKMYHMIDQREKAIHILEGFMEDHCAATDLHLVNLLATLYMEQKEYGKAIEHIELATSMYQLQQLPLFVNVTAGICHAHLGNLSQSEMYLNELQVDLIGDQAYLLCQVADAMMNLGYYEVELKYLLLFEETSGHGNGSLYLKIAKCYLNLKENEKAISFLYKAVNLMEDCVDARLDLATLLCGENKEDEAISFLIPPKTLDTDQQSSDANAWWLNLEIRKKLAKMYSTKGMFAEVVETILLPIQETLFIETMNMKVKPRKKLPRSILSERAKLLDGEQNDIMFRGLGPIASSTDMRKAHRARKKLQKLAAEKEDKKAATLAAGLEWHTDDESDEEPQQTIKEPPLPNLLKDDEHYLLLLDVCKALESLQRYWEELEIINHSLKVGQHILPPDRKEELQLLGVRVAYKIKDPTNAYNYAKNLVLKHPYSISAWNRYYKVVSRMENGFPRHAKFLLRMRSQYKDCASPMLICGHQFTLNRLYQTAAKEYLEAYKLHPDNPLINLCVGTALINLALGFRVQNKIQCVTQGFAFLYNCQRLCESSQESLYNLGRAYQHVGFVTLAAACYEKVLGMHTKDYTIPRLPNEDSPVLEKDGHCSLRREAAYNLHLIFKNSGAIDLARQVLKDHCTP